MRTILFSLLSVVAAHAAPVEYDLELAEQPWSPGSGIKPIRALTLNGGIPGPTLRFREGDTARIRVHNRLKGEETSIHWHGLLLPNVQDGVPHVTTPPIQPGTTHTFEFPLKHAGTYWYHSHTGLQEQRGVYGSIVVEPRGGEPVRSDRDQVVVLSDWTRENPDEVMRTLMRGSEWYQLKKGSIQSLAGAAKAGALTDFWDRERSRMPAMDISDVAYDAFLANGRRSLELAAKPGDKVRLRFVNAAASTYFCLHSATGPLTIVAADGPPVKPLAVKRLLVGMAETYDVIVTVPSSGRWEVRASAQDGSGHASVWLGEGEQPYAQPKEMTESEIEEAIADFARSAALAVEAGFDGVELHGANGYLIDQFLNTASNQRTDPWGGSIQNRIRFPVEIARRTAAAIGKERVGIRLSPYGVFNDMTIDPAMEATFESLVAELDRIGLVYVHLVDHSAMGAPEVPASIKEKIRAAFQGTLILSGGYDRARAEADLEASKGDLIAFGRPFISNPNLVTKLRTGAALLPADPATFYSPGETGYTDYPA